MQSEDALSGARLELITRGFAVLPRLFTDSDIVKLRGIIISHLKMKRAGTESGFGRIETLAALKMPEVIQFIAHEKLLEAVRSLLNTTTPEFLLHCDAHLNDLSGWHKDTGDAVIPNGYFGRPIFDHAECPVVKFAIYCEDHEDDDEGLHVKPGSHRSPTLDSGTEYALSTKVGDVVAFDVRLTHMGVRQSPRHRRIVGVTELTPQRMRRHLRHALEFGEARLFPRADRAALFFSYGAKGIDEALTRTFARSNWDRACRQGGRATDVPGSLVERLESHGLTVTRFQ